MFQRAVATLFVLTLAMGCAPERQDSAPGELEGSDRMAVLASDGGGLFDILIMDRAGNELDRIDANLSNPVGISWHPQRFFIVSDGMNLQRVELDGSVSRFNDEPLSGIAYRTSVDGEGNVTVAEEYDATELDDEGEVISSSTVPGTYCWMDAAEGGVLLDVFGPNLAVWDTDTNEFDIVASFAGASATIVGTDDRGTHYLGSSYDDQIWLAEADGARSLGRLSAMGLPAWGVRALEPAGHDSVFTLYEGAAGSGIAELGSGGTLTELLAADGEVWLDLTVY